MFSKNEDKIEKYYSLKTGKFISRDDMILELKYAVLELQSERKVLLSDGFHSIEEVVAMLIEYLDLTVQKSNTKLVKRNEETQ